MAKTWVAPGRVNLIGEHVDYNDGLCLPFALPLLTTAAVTRRDDTTDVVVESAGRRQTFAVTCEPGDVEGWARYFAAVVWAVRQQHPDLPGLSVEVTSDVPVGAGLSSSAALECALAGAIADEVGLELSPLDLAKLAHRAENDFVGVPSGTMDQLAAVFGADGHAVLIDCRDLSTRPVRFAPEDDGLRLLVVDTHAEHEHSGGEYAERRRQCEHARDVLGLVSMRDATLDDVDRLDDPVLRRRTHHVVTEIARVTDVVEILDAGRPQDIGGHLTASHLSLRDEYEVSCAELDVTVDAALSAGALGARMTGGGFGGCAIVLTRAEDVEAVTKRVEAAYDRRGWRSPTIFTAQPSPGAHRVVTKRQVAH
jgi:galactokinase